MGSSGVWELFVPDASAGPAVQVPDPRVRTGSGGRRPTRWPRYAEVPARDRVGGLRLRPRVAGRRLGRPARRPARAVPASRSASTRSTSAPGGPGLSYQELADAADRLRGRAGLHPRRVHAGDGAPVRRVLGLPGDRVLRPDRPLRRPGRVPVPGRPAAPGRHRRDPRLGAGPLPQGRVGAGPVRRHPALRARRTRCGASTPTGVPTSSTSAGPRCAISWSPTPSTGPKSSMWTVCGSTRSPRCSTWTTPARTASGSRTSTVDGRTSTRWRSCRS